MYIKKMQRIIIVGVAGPIFLRENHILGKQISFFKRLPLT